MSVNNFFVSARVISDVVTKLRPNKRIGSDEIASAVGKAIAGIQWPPISVKEVHVRTGDYPVVVKTSNELMEETRRILEASKEELERMHHAAFPAERASIHGVRHGRKSDMQADLLLALFGH